MKRRSLSNPNPRHTVLFVPSIRVTNSGIRVDSESQTNTQSKGTRERDTDDQKRSSITSTPCRSSSSCSKISWSTSNHRQSTSTESNLKLYKMSITACFQYLTSLRDRSCPDVICRSHEISSVIIPTSPWTVAGQSARVRTIARIRMMS